MIVLFDLDGTLLDSTDLLLAGYKHAVRTHLSSETCDGDWLPHFGRPLRTQMAIFSEEHADVMTQTYRSFYAEHHDTMMRLYPGVPEALQSLQAAGCRMGVVTSKLTKFAHRALDLFDLSPYFEIVIGEDLAHAHKPDPAPVLKALECMGGIPEDAWMVGDSEFDIQAGHNAGCRAAAVLWGPFTREVLAPHHPEAFLERVSEIPTLINLPR